MGPPPKRYRISGSRHNITPYTRFFIKSVRWPHLLPSSSVTPPFPEQVCRRDPVTGERLRILAPGLLPGADPTALLTFVNQMS